MGSKSLASIYPGTMVINSDFSNQDYVGTLTDLSLSVSAEPNEVCNGYPTQLNAIATGLGIERRF